MVLVLNLRPWCHAAWPALVQCHCPCCCMQCAHRYGPGGWRRAAPPCDLSTGSRRHPMFGCLGSKLGPAQSGPMLGVQQSQQLNASCPPPRPCSEPSVCSISVAADRFAMTRHHTVCAPDQHDNEQVLEVGPVGWAPDEASQHLFVHSQQGLGFGNASRLVDTAVQAGAGLTKVSKAWAVHSQPHKQQILASPGQSGAKR